MAEAVRPTVAICFVKSLDEPEIINYTLGTSKQSGKRIRQAALRRSGRDLPGKKGQLWESYEQ